MEDREDVDRLRGGGSVTVGGESKEDGGNSFREGGGGSFREGGVAVLGEGSLRMGFRTTLGPEISRSAGRDGDKRQVCEQKICSGVIILDPS